MALQRLTEACEKAKCDLSSMPQTTINLPYITAVSGGAEAFDADADPRQVRKHLRPALRTPARPGVERLKDAGVKPADIDEVVLVGGSTRMPQVPGHLQRNLRRQGTAQGRQSRRSGRDRRSDPGRGAHRRRAGYRAARRHPALAGRRNARRRDDHDDPAQHHDPASQDAKRSRRPPTASRPWTSTSCRANARWPRTTARWDVSSSPASRRPARRPADRSDVRHQRRRHPERDREGQGHEQGTEDRDQGVLGSRQDADRPHGLAKRPRTQLKTRPRPK